MFTDIVWATDGSEHADRALGHAVQIARSDHAELHVVHVIEKLVSPKLAGQDMFLSEDQTDAKIRAQAAQIEIDHGIKTTVRMSTGTAGHAAGPIARIAEDIGADLIVIGTRGRSAVAGLMLGGVTQRLLHESPCPILAVPPTAVVQPEPRPKTTTAAA
jgi:nucleotide-binding universal stress UspA family protein